MPEQDQEKSQEATPHRRQMAREEGQVAQSQDLAAALLLVIALAALLWMGPAASQELARATQRYLGGEAWLVADVPTIRHEWFSAVVILARVLLPFLVLLFVVAVASHLLQVGFLFLPEKLTPDWQRIDPLAGLRRLFSLQNSVHLGFGILKIVIVSAIAVWTLWTAYLQVFALAGQPMLQIAVGMSQIILWTALKIAAALLVLALLDYGWQRFKHEQDLRMTFQEVREELRNMQGDPQILARRRTVQRQLVLNRLKQAVPKADVVVTNPTELAIAIQYDHATMAAPIVVAKGAGVLAQRIRKLALENGIPILERKPLAQALYKQVDLNHPVPADLYGPVAEVLAYVYQLKGKQVPQTANRFGR